MLLREYLAESAVILNQAGDAIGQDALLAAPSRHTPLVQQVHVCLYHYLCEHIERRMMEAHRHDGA